MGTLWASWVQWVGILMKVLEQQSQEFEYLALQSCPSFQKKVLQIWLKLMSRVFQACALWPNYVVQNAALLPSSGEVIVKQLHV